MKIIFKETIMEKEIKIEPLFAYNDNSYDNVSIETIIENMRNMVDEEKNKKIKFKILYAGNFKFHDCPPQRGRNERKDIEILVRLVNGCVDEILKTGEKYSYFDEYAELLNKEVKDENIKYEAYKVRGELK